MLSSIRQNLDILFNGDPGGYKKWVIEHDTLTDPEREWMRGQSAQMREKPLISIIMPVYNPPVEILKLALESVLKQVYPHWELCIADDASTDRKVIETLQAYSKRDSRIKVVYRTANGHISAASNSAVELATGPWLALFDHDDELAEHALYCVAREINAYPGAKLIYTDEDKITNKGRRFDPYFKPDWNPALLTGQNFFNHLGVYWADLVRAVGGFRVGYEGSQDYDLLWRCVEKVKPEEIRHIPYILYHWRALPGSVAEGMEGKSYAPSAARRAMQEHLDREGILGHVEKCPENLDLHRVLYSLPVPAPQVQVFIPVRDKVHLSRTCVDSFKAVTQYDNYEIVIIDNDSQEEATRAWLSEFASQPRCRVIHVPGAFSYSRINNAAIRQTNGDIVLLLNNDVEIIEGFWLKEMISQLIQKNVGAVGARLWYPNQTLQHGGVTIGQGGVAGHNFSHSRREEQIHFCRNVLTQNLSAVTAACMAVRRTCFDEVGGFDEENLPIQLNDIDLCLRLREAGYDIVWTPYAELIHHESKSRGYNVSPEQMETWEREKNYFRKRWAKWIEHDPAYNPNLTADHCDFRIANPPRHVPPWKKAIQ